MACGEEGLTRMRSRFAHPCVRGHQGCRLAPRHSPPRIYPVRPADAERDELLRSARRRKAELLRDLKARHETQVVLLEMERRSALEGLRASVAGERAKVRSRGGDGGRECRLAQPSFGEGRRLCVGRIALQPALRRYPILPHAPLLQLHATPPPSPQVEAYKRDLAALDESIESARSAMKRFRSEFEALRVALLVDRMAKSCVVD